MALILLGNGIVDARGSVGGSVLSRSRFGATMCAKVSPTQFMSKRRMIIRASLSTISGQWQSTLTAVERASWNSFALTNPAVNVFGQTKYLSGHQWFCRCNTNLLNAGAALITTPPVSATVPGLTSLTISPSHAGGGAVALAFTNAGLPADYYLDIKFTGPISKGIYYVRNQFRQVDYVHNATSIYTTTTAYRAVFPGIAYATGQKVFCLATIMDSTTGIESPAIIADGIVS